MKPLTPSQLRAMQTVLARYGLVVKAAPKKRTRTNDELSDRIARVKAMRFSTPSVKSGLLRTLVDCQRNGHWYDNVKGVTSYRRLNVPWMPNDPHVIAAYYANLDDRDFDAKHGGNQCELKTS